MKPALSLRELSLDLGVITEQLDGLEEGQVIMNRKLDLIIKMLETGGPGPKPDEEDLSTLPSEETAFEDVLTPAYDGTTDLFHLDFSPVVYGSLELFANDIKIPVDQFFAKYTTGAITIKAASKAGLKGKKISAKYNCETVELANYKGSVKDTSIFVPYKGLVPSSIKIVVEGKLYDAKDVVEVSDGTTFKPDTTDTVSLGLATVSFKVVLPLLYDRVTGVDKTGAQISHSFKEKYVTLFSIKTDTDGDNGELGVSNGELTSTLVNTGLQGIDSVYASIHDTSRRVHTGKGVYGSQYGAIVLHDLGTTDYVAFAISLSANLDGSVGEVYVSEKGKYNLSISNTGENTNTEFMYLVIKKSFGTEMGEASFNGAGDGVRTITHNLSLDKYSVLVQPTEDTDGDLGDVWVECNSNDFKIHSTGGSGVKFDYLIVED